MSYIHFPSKLVTNQTPKSLHKVKISFTVFFSEIIIQPFLYKHFHQYSFCSYQQIIYISAASIMKRKRKEQSQINKPLSHPVNRHVGNSGWNSTNAQALVSLSCVFKRLFDGVSKEATKKQTEIQASDSKTTPITTKNKRKCKLGNFWQIYLVVTVVVVH